MPSARHKEAWASVALAVVVGLTLGVPSVAGASFQFVRHGRCVAGPVAASGVFWTPVTIVDSPPNFNNSSTQAVATAWAPGVVPVFLNLSDGEAGGEFSLDHWALVHQSIQWVAGPGSTSGCPAYSAADLSRMPGNGTRANASFFELLPSGSSSDVGVPHMFNMSAPNGSNFSSVFFVANYSDGYSGLSFRQITQQNALLGAGGYEWLTQSAVGTTIFVVIPFQAPNGGPLPYGTWLTGVTSVRYTMFAPWDGCIQWGGNVGNPFGTGLSFGPPPTSGFSCSYP
jgi:hypothetical protein